MTSSYTNAALAQVLSQAERSVLRGLAEVVEAHGSTIEQWRILTLLADGRGHPMGEIADYAFVPAPTLTRIVDAMVSDTLVYRRVDPDDRRRVLTFSTARGQRLHSRLQSEIASYESGLATSNSDVDIKHLAGLLTQLVQRLSEQRAKPGARADAGVPPVRQNSGKGDGTHRKRG